MKKTKEQKGQLKECRVTLTIEGPCADCGEETLNTLVMVDPTEDIHPRLAYRNCRCAECFDAHVEGTSADAVKVDTSEDAVKVDDKLDKLLTAMASKGYWCFISAGQMFEVAFLPYGTDPELDGMSVYKSCDLLTGVQGAIEMMGVSLPDLEV